MYLTPDVGSNLGGGEASPPHVISLTCHGVLTDYNKSHGFRRGSTEGGIFDLISGSVVHLLLITLQSIIFFPISSLTCSDSDEAG